MNEVNKITQISTLSIYTREPITTKEQYVYLLALQSLVEQYDKNSRVEDTLTLYLQNSEFLILNHNKEQKCNTIAFVNAKGEVYLDVDIAIFQDEIERFKTDYIADTKKRHPELKEPELFKTAIRDYRNDIIDFYSHSDLIPKEIINEARRIIKERQIINPIRSVKDKKNEKEEP